MAILGIIFGQKRTVIGVKEGSNLGGALGALQGVLRQTIGGVAGIVIDATIREEHLTTLDLTDNEVEDGASITDHAQIRPAQLTIEGVISDYPLGYAYIGNIQNVIRTASNLFGGSSRSIDAYNDLLALQKSRQPFSVYTGLKRYKNMIITQLSAPRDSSTGGSLRFTATMREVIIAKTENFISTVSDSTKSLVNPIKDKGNRITSAVPIESSLSSDSSSVSSASRGNTSARNIFGEKAAKAIEEYVN